MGNVESGPDLQSGKVRFCALLTTTIAQNIIKRLSMVANKDFTRTKENRVTDKNLSEARCAWSFFYICDMLRFFIPVSI
jgi:hypothetical protein